MKDAFIHLRQHLLSGVSFAIPFIACGGILIAAAIAMAPIGPHGPDFTGHPTLKLMLDIGVAAFTLMPAVLAGYISYSVAGKPGLVAGMVGGWLATHLGTTMVNGEAKDVSAGFLGAMIAGLIAGYFVGWFKKLPVPKFVRPIMPIMVIPIVSSLFIGVVMLKIIGLPIAALMTDLGGWLTQLQTGSAIVLALILGAMIAFDMGGPINKVAFFFGAGLIAQGNYTVMGAVAAAICVPPLGLGLATIISRRQWREEDREAGVAAFAMGFIGITEGAIPFAAGDPLRVIPCIMVGSMTASTIAMLGGVRDHAPHGGPIVIPVIDNRLMFIVAIVTGTLVTALLMNGVKKFTTKPIVADAPVV
jgi:PTS system fructose-specific IIC component